MTYLVIPFGLTLFVVSACLAAPQNRIYPSTTIPNERAKRDIHPILGVREYNEQKNYDLIREKRQNDMPSMFYEKLATLPLHRVKRLPEYFSPAKLKKRQGEHESPLDENAEKPSDDSIKISLETPSEEISQEKEAQSQSPKDLLVQKEVSKEELETSSEKILDEASKEPSPESSTIATEFTMLNEPMDFYRVFYPKKFPEPPRMFVSREGYYLVTAAPDERHSTQEEEFLVFPVPPPIDLSSGIPELKALARFLSGRPGARRDAPDQDAATTTATATTACEGAAEGPCVAAPGKPPLSMETLRKAWRVAEALGKAGAAYESAARALFSALRRGQEKGAVPPAVAWLMEGLEETMKRTEDSVEQLREVGSRVIADLARRLHHPIPGSMDDLTNILSMKSIHLCFSQLWLDIVNEVSKITASIPEDELEAFKKVVQYIQPCLQTLTPSTESPDTKTTLAGK